MGGNRLGGNRLGGLVFKPFPNVGRIASEGRQALVQWDPQLSSHFLSEKRNFEIFFNM